MMERSSLKVLLGLDSDGYVVDYQQEFWDGSDWQTPFDTTNAVSLPQSEIDKIVLGASKLVDGHIVVDQDKISQINAENDAAQKKLEQDQVTIDSLKQQNDLLQSAVMELSNYVFSLPDGSTTGSAS